MSETERPIQQLPRWFNAVFDESRMTPYAKQRVLTTLPNGQQGWAEKWTCPHFDVRDADGRRQYALENIRAYSSGRAPVASWKGITDEWLVDMQYAAEMAGMRRTEVRETELDIKAMMAVSAAAKAMEASDGSAGTYAAFLAPDGRGGVNTDLADDWREYLLASSPDKLERVINMRGVKTLYMKILTDAGMDIPDEWKTRDIKYSEETVSGDLDPTCLEAVQIDATDMAQVERARDGKLVEYMRKMGEKGGFDAYIEEEILGNGAYIESLAKAFGMSPGSVEAAAKLAADAFLVNDFTRWEWSITGEGNEEAILRDPHPKTKKREEVLLLRPVAGWGGDPFRAALKPSHLPGAIKGVYKEGLDKEVMDRVDEAFRPSDVFVKGSRRERDAVQPTAVENFKKAHRWNLALWTFFGKSRAPTIPMWDRETMEKSLPDIAELLDQVYGGQTFLSPKEIPGEDPPGVEEGRIGDHIVGLMMARILETKAYATTADMGDVNWRARREIFFKGFDEESPHAAVVSAIWGKDRDWRNCLLSRLQGGRTRMILDDRNVFNSISYVDKTYKYLFFNSQDPEVQRQLELLNYGGMGWEVLKVFGKALFD